MKTKILSGICWLILSGTLFFLSCTNGNSENEKISVVYNSLKDNEASVLLKINGKEFYPSASVFKGRIEMLKNLFSMTLIDQTGGQVIVNFGGDKWYKQSPIEKEIFADNQVGGSVKVGKIVDSVKMIGEGYMMSSGKIKALDFSPGKIVFHIEGKVGKYSDFQSPDKLETIEGLIVYRMPQINFQEITGKDVFNSSDTK